MTEVLIAVTFAIAGATLVGVQNAGAFVKTVVWGFTLLALLLHIVGRGITAPEKLRTALAETVSDWWPLVILAAFIVSGSLYARFVEEIKETFLGFGIGMFFLPLTALAVRTSARPLSMLKLLAVVYVCSVLGMMVLLGLGRGPFHEEIFFAVPLGTYLLSARPLRPGPAFVGFLLIGVCLLSVKNTTFLLVLTAVVACSLVWVGRVRSSGDSLRRFTILYFSTLIVSGIVGALVYAYIEFRSHLPSGNTEYRIEMYGIAWRRFLDSPAWGSAFADSAVTYFELYRVAVSTQTLPTHSDVLDMLAHGGLIALLLWGLTVWRLLAIGWDALRRVAVGAPTGADSQAAVDMRPWRWLFVMSLVEVSAIVTYAFNPLLHRPSHGVVIWGIAGALWALHRHLTHGPLVGTAPVKMWQRQALQ